PQALARACLADARRLGATLLTEPVQSVTVADGRATGVVSPQGSTAAGLVVAAGAWSRAIGALPSPPAVEPVRGQMAATAWPAEMPAAILYNEHCYVL